MYFDQSTRPWFNCTFNYVQLLIPTEKCFHVKNGTWHYCNSANGWVDFEGVGSNLPKGDLPNHDLPTQKSHDLPKHHDGGLSAGELLGAPFGHKPSLVLLLFYCWSLHTSLKNNVSVVKTMFQQIADVTNFWQIVIWQIAQFFFLGVLSKTPFGIFFGRKVFGKPHGSPLKIVNLWNPNSG